MELHGTVGKSRARDSGDVYKSFMDSVSLWLTFGGKVTSAEIGAWSILRIGPLSFLRALIASTPKEGPASGEEAGPQKQNSWDIGSNALIVSIHCNAPVTLELRNAQLYTELEIGHSRGGVSWQRPSRRRSFARTAMRCIGWFGRKRVRKPLIVKSHAALAEVHCLHVKASWS
jgi:hypothetical protein